MAERLSLPPGGGYGVAERRAVLVGRATEMHELDDALRAVRDKKKPRALTLTGAGGIGKTRLLRDFLVKLRGQGDKAPRVFRGAARENEASYGVFARVLRARFGLSEGMDVETQKKTVHAEVAKVMDDRKVGDVCYFLGQILDLKFQDSPLVRAVEGDPAEVVALRRTVLKHFIESDAAAGATPLILVFEDLQFSHDDSLALLGYLLDQLKGQILIVSVARNDMLARRDGFTRHGEGHHKVLELEPLSETDSSAVMQDLLAPCGESAEVDELIESACTMAGGNPALLEQMVRIYLDMGVLEVEDPLAEEEKWKIHSEKLAGVSLPMTVQDAVEARIASLAPEERDLLERSAAMGGVFWLGGLVAMHRQDHPVPAVWGAGEIADIAKLRASLEDLIDRDYVLKLPDSSVAGEEEYVFKHNLERETLLKITPPTKARRYHAAIADWLSFKEHVRTHEEYVATLARHRELSGALSQAAAAYLDAADVARARYANVKAVEYYAKGLGLLRRGEEEQSKRRDGRATGDGPAALEADQEQWIRSLHHYGDVLQSLGKNDEALAAFREMLARSYRLDQRTKGGAAHSRIGRLYRETGRLEDAAQHLEAALALFEEAHDDRGIASTVDDVGKLHWLRGDYPKALESTQRALAARRKIGDRRSIALSLNNLGLVYQDSGQFVQALDCFEQALKIRREIGDLVGVTISLNNLGTVAQDQRDDSRALALFQEAYEVAKETGDRNRIALVLTNLGETYNRLGDPQQAIHYLKQAEELSDELGDKMGLAEAVRGLGKAYLAQREYTKARECTQRAVEIFTEIQSKVQVGVALRSLGEVTAAASAGGEGLKSARGYLKQAIAIFEEIGNDVELARSCRAYADMLRGTTEYQTDPNVIREASAFAKRADEIFAKLKISAFGLEPDAFFAG